MKRFTGILIAALLVLAPLSASALEALTDSALNDVTGQAGIDIALDDVAILIESVQDTTYTDTDTGLGIKIEHHDNINKLILLDGIYDESTDGQVLNYNIAAINAIFTDNDDFVANRAGSVGVGTLREQADLNGDDTVSAFVSRPRPLSIDIGKCEILSAARDYYLTGSSSLDRFNVGGVIIGLPTVTIEIYTDQDHKVISLDYTAELDGNHSSLGTTRAAMLANYGEIIEEQLTLGGSTTGTVQALIDAEVKSKGTSGSTAVQLTTLTGSMGSIDRQAAGMGEYIAITKSGYAKYAILGGTLEIAPH